MIEFCNPFFLRFRLLRFRFYLQGSEAVIEWVVEILLKTIRCSKDDLQSDWVNYYFSDRRGQFVPELLPSDVTGSEVQHIEVGGWQSFRIYPGYDG